ncbi:MAG: FHA domain-containing protein [Synergistaceae bacterium]|jgi:hypothetical protein|nr:FHA domain-containing protein [Synergistaceae bacterium]
MKIKAEIAAAGMLLALLAFFCPVPRALAGDTVKIYTPGHETVPLNDKGDYVDIVYDGDPGGGVQAYRERDISPETPGLAAEGGADEIPEPEEDEIPLWKSRAAKIAYACIGAVCLVAALWQAVRGLKAIHARKTAIAAEETLPATHSAQPRSVQPLTVRAEPHQPSQSPALPAKAEVRLTTVSPTDVKQYTARVADKIEIGRGEQCQIRIEDDASVSSRHCEISWDEGALHLRDLGSSNGTSVNGVPVRGTRKLEPDDVIELGRVRLRLGEVKTL